MICDRCGKDVCDNAHYLLTDDNAHQFLIKLNCRVLCEDCFLSLDKLRRKQYLEIEDFRKKLFLEVENWYTSGGGKL
jgi:hypothetical protein